MAEEWDLIDVDNGKAIENFNFKTENGKSNESSSNKQQQQQQQQGEATGDAKNTSPKKQGTPNKKKQYNNNNDQRNPTSPAKSSSSNSNNNNKSGKARTNNSNNNENGHGGSSSTSSNNNNNKKGREIRGRGKRNDNVEGAENRETKPKEIYIPPSPSMDEKEIFSQGIESGINFEDYDKIPIKVTGENLPMAIESFESAGLAKTLQNNVEKSGYLRPTPIQKQAIPIIMANRDLMGCSQTGSGKTASFLLPILNILLETKQEVVVGQPQVVIISPTRELSIQTYNEARKFAMGTSLKISVIYGGTSSKHQTAIAAEGCDILVATPGRLWDFVQHNTITFQQLRCIVLDEADRMLDLGFLPAIEKIMRHKSMVAKQKRQTLMFSATFPEEIQLLAGKFLTNYIFLAIGIIGGACSDVEQEFFKVTRFEKRERLMTILNESEASGIMVFVETKRQADFLASLLSESKHPTTSIHGARLQRQREEALNDFKLGKMKVLIATSVAARGLDIKNVSHVINFDLPKDIDEYVHRIGRTGRVGNRGKATSFYDPQEDVEICADLVKILKQANQSVPEFLLLAEVKTGGEEEQPGAEDLTYGGSDVRTNQQQTPAADAPPASKATAEN